MKEEMYLTQLAQKIGIPVNTTIYHIQLLNDSKIITTQIRSGRNYYKLNKKYFSALIILAKEYEGEVEG